MNWTDIINLMKLCDFLMKFSENPTKSMIF